DLAAPPVCDRDETLPAEAAAALAAPAHPDAIDVRGHALLQGLGDRGLWRRLLVFLHFLPEFFRLALARFGVRPEPRLAFEQQGRLRFLQAMAMAAQYGFRRCLVADGTGTIRCELRAGDEANEVEHIGHLGGFVEIVDAPDKTTIAVAPGAEVLQMQVA